jgi:hypothetical protein
MIVDTIAKIEKDKIKSVEAKKDAEDEWTDLVAHMADKTLFPKTRYASLLPYQPSQVSSHQRSHQLPN